MSNNNSSNNKNNNPEQRLFTAVCFTENQEKNPSALAMPLLLTDDSKTLRDESESERALHSLMKRWRLMGMLLGFLVQIVNVLGSTYTYLRWGEPHAHQDVRYESEADRLLHWVVFLVAQVDIYLYFAMWIALSAALTRPGVKFAQRHFFSPETVPSKRAVFIMGIYFYVGVVVGVFLAWASVDAFLGLPVSVLPMLSVLLFGLAISYTMVWCYDREEKIEDYDCEDENDDTNEC
jgi:magnesium-transporting ATPase (P-type)